MYAWGDDTSTWRGSKSYDFDSARSPYLDKLKSDADVKGPRSYLSGSKPDMKLVDPKDKCLYTESKNPIVVGVDVTGSMSSWPREIFDRLPLLYQTLSQYRDDVEISFCAIGDATCDNYPLQVNNFGKGVGLEDHLKAIYPEGGGGGHITESYELFGYMMNNKCEMPNATSPFLIMFGDETFYDTINPNQVKHYIGDDLQSIVNSQNMWDGLMQKFNVYMLRKPYSNPSADEEIKGYWENALGKQRVIELPSAERAVDIALGLIAKTWGEYGDFKDSLDARHDDKSLKESVYHSLRYVDDKPSDLSVLVKTDSMKKSKSLMDMD
jgi:hypothetical protein